MYYVFRNKFICKRGFARLKRKTRKEILNAEGLLLLKPPFSFMLNWKEMARLKVEVTFRFKNLYLSHVP